MESFTVKFCRSQKCIAQLLIIGSLCLALTLAQVLAPKDATDILKKHNEYRKQESASNMYLLQWNVSLQERADAWAKQCMFKHERNPDVGENLYFDTDHENEVFLRGLEGWHKEKSKWGYTSHSCKGACHFTQIVWGYTTTVGCSANVCPSLSVANRNIKNAMLLVCYYYPRGNFVGNFPYARGRPCSECAPGDTCVDNLCVSSGLNSKLAPDYVKKLAPKSPISSSSSSRSFQEFTSLIQQSASASSHGHHQQQSHHRREHHEQQHHHQQQQHQQQHFKSESSLSAASASHSYSSQHSHSSQQHRQAYYSSQVSQQQLAPGAQVSTENNYLKEQERQQAQQREDKRREEVMEQHRQHREEMEKRRQGVIEEQQRQIGFEQQREIELKQQRQIELEQQRNKELKQRNIEMEQQRQIGLEQQRQQELKQRNTEIEQQRQAELEQQRQQELNQRNIEMEQQRQTGLEQHRQQELKQRNIEMEQQRQTGLEQQRQNLLVRKRQKEEEDEYLEMLKQQDDEHKQRVAQELAHRIRQTDEERRRNLEEEQRRDREQLRIQEERYRQSLLDATKREKNRASSTERFPKETYRVTESPYDYNVRSRYYPNGYQERTTLGANIPVNHEEYRSQRPTQTDSSRNDPDSTLSRLDEEYQRKSVDHRIFSSRSHGSLTAQSSTVDDVVKLLSRGESDQTKSYGQQSRLQDELLPPEWSGRTQETESNFISKDVRTSMTISENQSQREFIDNISDDDSNDEVNTSVDTRQSLSELDESGRKKQPQETRTTHLKKKWRYRQSERQKLENEHRHKDTYIMETDGRRCVDRHEECSRWAIKCYKSSAVTLSCPMTCGKCGLHVSNDEDLQGDQTTDNSPKRRSSPDGQKNGRRKKAGGRQLTTAERKARREQRRLERQRNAPSALMARPDPEVTDRQQPTERTMGEKRQRRKGRRRPEKQRHNQARQDLCRDDPKHVKSCKYWARKGFCLDNKLIANLYCQHSCNSCQ